MATTNQKRLLRGLLKEYRQGLGLRQVDLAKRLKKPQSYVSKYESGEKNLTFLELREVCAGLEVSFNAFVKKFDRLNT